MKRDYLETVRTGGQLNRREQMLLIIQLSIPAVMAQLSSVIMQYIDASMVGRLGADSSASIGLMSSTTWLMGGLCNAAAIGFTVQVAHKIGAGRNKEARGIVRHGLLYLLAFSLVLSMIGCILSGYLPGWLGGDESIRKMAGSYFWVYALALPALEMRMAAGGMLQSSGNMRVPSALNILMCFLDVLFNWVLIFPEVRIGGFCMPGAGLGVTGAALGTALSEVVVSILMLLFLLLRSEELRPRRGEKAPFSKEELLTAIRIAVPVGVESAVMGGAYVVFTRIVSPLGNIALSANSFAVTAESLCYMPGYGIAAAATTLIGQSIGAGRRKLARRMGLLTTGFGMAVMAGTGVLLFIFAPYMMGLLTPDPAIRALGTEVLRIEAFAEPMFAASIVSSGVFRGAGDTLVPSLLNFVSMWLVRLTLAAFLAPRLGLRGVWIAMCVELWVRGLLFLVRLIRKFLI